jgi:uncharacterized membrane protein YqjE
MTTDQATTDRIRERLKRGEEEARELGHNVADIAAEIRLLAAQEAELGMAEMKEQANYAVRGGIMGAVAFLMLNLVLVFLGLAILFALETALPFWAAALITAGIYLLVAAILGMVAMSFIKKVSFQPKRMINSLKEDVQWAKNLMTSNAR